MADDVAQAERREVYVTPTAYLELIQTFQTLLARKRKEIDLVRRRYDNGLQQLESAGAAVETMKEQLIKLQPELITAKAETEQMTEKVDKEVKEVIEPKKEVRAATGSVLNQLGLTKVAAVVVQHTAHAHCARTLSTQA
jgi:dynein heavy chain